MAAVSPARGGKGREEEEDMGNMITMMPMRYWCRYLMVWVVMMAFGAPPVQAQTIGQRFVVHGGFAHLSGLRDYRQGVYLGGRAYLGPWVFVSGSGNLHQKAHYYTFGVGGVLPRSTRWRVLMHAGFLATDGYGLPIGGVGIEYGGKWGGVGQLDYVLTRTSGEGLFVVNGGIYWSR